MEIIAWWHDLREILYRRVWHWQHKIRGKLTPEDLALFPPEPPPPEPPPRPVDPARAARRAEMRKMAKARLKIADRIDAILLRFEQLNLREYESEVGTRPNMKLNELWSNLMGCDFHFLDEALSEASNDHETLFFNTVDYDDGHKDLADLVEEFWPFDHAITYHQNEAYFLSRLYTVTPPEVRGRTKAVAPKMLRHVYGYLFDDGGWWLDDTVYGWLGGQWRQLPMTDQVTTETRAGILVGYTDMSSKRQKEIHSATSMMFSMKLTERYEWHVALGPNEGGPRILLPTSPIGCQVLFKDRDKLGKSRRAALRQPFTQRIALMTVLSSSSPGILWRQALWLWSAI